MGNYRELYKRKLTDVQGALSLIPDGAMIGQSYCASEPQTLLSNLHLLKEQGKKVTVLRGLTTKMYPFAQDPQYKDSFTVESTFFMGPDRLSHKEGISSYVPTHLHSVTDGVFKYHRPNVALISVTPMDRHGYVRSSLTLITEQELVEGADLVIAEINPNMPYVHGETEIHISQIDALIEVEDKIPEIPEGEVTEIDKIIGEYVGSLIHDGDTIQLGIGGIPDASAKALMCKHDLGVHTEMITNSIVDLVEAGVINGRKKNIHKGKVIGTFALGSKRLYDLMDDNPSIHLLRGSYVNNPYVVAQNDNMVSINTCIGIDLVGQVCSESLGHMQYSGTGGQHDTAFGAVRSRGGKSIIALHSTAKNGTISTITPIVSPGYVVTLSRNDVDYIITEYGIASMRGRSVRERAKNLIAIAHPDFREELRRQAEKLMFI